MRTPPRLALLGLVASLGWVACGASSEEPPPSPLTLVLGVGAACVAEVQRVEVIVKKGSSLDLERRFDDISAASFPLSLTLALSRDAAIHYSAEIAFFVRSPSGAARPIRLLFPFSGGTSGRAVVSLPCGCLGLDCAAGLNCVELPVGSGKVSCVNPSRCGDERCEPPENSSLCPADCPGACGDGLCSADETCASCSIDCGSCCGDAKCNGGETCASCPKDCGSCGGSGAAGQGGKGPAGGAGQAGAGQGGAGQAGAAGGDAGQGGQGNTGQGGEGSTGQGGTGEAGQGSAAGSTGSAGQGTGAGSGQGAGGQGAEAGAAGAVVPSCGALASAMGWAHAECQQPGADVCDGKGQATSDCQLCCDLPSCGDAANAKGWSNPLCENPGNPACGGGGVATWDCSRCCNGPVACPSPAPCSFGQIQCASGPTYEECVPDGDGCASWATRDCVTSAPCSSDLALCLSGSSCSPGCVEGFSECVDAGLARVCQLVDGCPAWVQQVCSALESCSGGACVCDVPCGGKCCGPGTSCFSPDTCCSQTDGCGDPGCPCTP